jgi:hypothetical protein
MVLALQQQTPPGGTTATCSNVLYAPAMFMFDRKLWDLTGAHCESYRNTAAQIRAVAMRK